jgi:glutathione S-transferase
VKLFHSPSSPFSRKVLACAVARDIDGQIEVVNVNAWTDEPALLAANPLGKVPCLVTADGLGLFDSPVICEYLESLEGALPLFPRAGGALWTALRYQAMADGIMDAGVLRRVESTRPADEARIAWMARQQAAIGRTLDTLERDPPHEMLNIGSISVGCALGYLDFRFGHEDWRPGRPRLTAWFRWCAENPCMARTRPQ